MSQPDRYQTRNAKICLTLCQVPVRFSCQYGTVNNMVQGSMKEADKGSQGEPFMGTSKPS